jgi:uncharacterized protein with FMN-binding domain
MSRNSSSPSLARRALPALVLTGASGLLLTALDRPISAGSSSSTAAETDVVTSVVTAPVATTATTATTTAKTSTTVASTVPATPVCTTITGSTISTRWGPVQVEASVTATGEICSVDAIVTPDDHDKSVRINDRAVPVLNESAMAAQGTDFDGVSGATITSNAYQQSLQSILDSLG